MNKPQDNKYIFHIYSKNYWLSSRFLFLFIVLAIIVVIYSESSSRWNIILDFAKLVISYIIFGLIYGWILRVPPFARKDPELTFTQDGIAIYRLGFIPWQEIKKISINYAIKTNLLVIELKENSLCKPDTKINWIGVSKIKYTNPRIIVINLDYLKTSYAEIRSIYKELALHVEQLNHIDHSKLF